ncbi:unnamed protein product [Heligmosomoides polygyrus]|uniref:Uncharacterized protein n=1 Tax=Heligmosomoides polygyrus TaxID=6339 RepID=A0A3P7XRL2_HELPZ|nr:unnamed protein product [Heligmosomoides polygyrus]
MADVEAELERANTDLRLTKEARKADQILWKIDRARGRNENLSDEDLRAVEHLQSQFRDCERFYTKETERLNEKLRSMSKELEQQRSRHDKIITELREQVRVLEIEQRNLHQKKDNQVAASEILEAGAARLQQVVHLNELQRLTRKYRLSSIIDQLQFVTDPIRRNGRSELDGNPDGIRYIINQLIAIRDEDAQTILPSDERCPSAQPSIDRNGYAPSVSECDGTYDNISQSSISIRSVASMPVHNTMGREELARGGQPSVRLMARAFEAIDSCPVEKQGFFGMRKSRSVETAQDRLQAKVEEIRSRTWDQSSLREYDAVYRGRVDKAANVRKEKTQKSTEHQPKRSRLILLCFSRRLERGAVSGKELDVT